LLNQTFLRLLAVVSIFILLTPGQALAKPVTVKEIRVAVRAFGFAYDLPKGDLEIEIIYNPQNPKSFSEAEKLSKILKGGMKVGSRKLRGKLTPVGQMGSTGNKIAYITGGLKQDYSSISTKASQAKLLTFTTDFSCVSEQICVMGISTTPTIKIEVSRSATRASQLIFSQALKFMIREVE